MLNLMQAMANGTFHFEAKGDRVVYLNNFFLSGDEQDCAPEETLLTAQTVKGNYGTVIEAHNVAQTIADFLNENLSRRLPSNADVANGSR
jgi:hypothetical protein